MSTLRQVILLGGSFDPIHNGHLHLARSAQNHCRADEVWFMPSGQPWQKNSLVATPLQRLEMTRLAVSPIAHWRVEDCEIMRSGPTYALDTLVYLKQRHHCEFIWAMGSDQLIRLHTWHRWEALFDYTRVGFLHRSCQTSEYFGSPAHVPACASEHVKPPAYLQPYFDQGLIFNIPMAGQDVSSSVIRQRLAKTCLTLGGRTTGDDHGPAAHGPVQELPHIAWLRRWIPAPVLQFIEANGLYCCKLASY